MGTVRKYSVAIWSRDSKGGKSVSHEYQGNSLEDAETIAAYWFAKKAIEAVCLKEKNLNPWAKKLEPEHLAELKDYYITVLDEEKLRLADREDNPKVLKSFGDSSVGIFKRYHLA